MSEIIGPISDMWRVDVAGYACSVRGKNTKDHLENINHQLAVAKLALHKIIVAFNNDCPLIAARAIEEMKNARS